MYYVYILYSSKSKNFYYGYTEDLRERFKEHNKGLSKATAPFRSWIIVFYAAFQTKKLAKDFERYIKSGSGKSFTYKRLVNSVVLKKDKIS
jgi:predicted GIY-YIG superfamily endonuclease